MDDCFGQFVRNDRLKVVVAEVRTESRKQTTTKSGEKRNIYNYKCVIQQRDISLQIFDEFYVAVEELDVVVAHVDQRN